jgi:hypothetical protein
VTKTLIDVDDELLIKKPGQQPNERTAAGHTATPGRHRLADGDVVPVTGNRRYADILNAPTREVRVYDVDDPLRMTPGQQHRSGVKRWLR